MIGELFLLSYKKSTPDNKSEVLSIMPQTGIEPVLDLTRTGF